MNLKKILFLLFLCLLGATKALPQTNKPYPYLRAQADLAKSYPFLLKVNIGSPFIRTANVAYEKFISSNKSVQIGCFYSNYDYRGNSFPWISLPVARYQSIGFTPEFRFYIDGKGRPELDGWFISPFFRFQYTMIKFDYQTGLEAERKITYKGILGLFNIGTVGGYKFILNRRWSLEAFAGPSVRVLHWYSSNNGIYQKEDFLKSPISIRGGITIGYVFL